MIAIELKPTRRHVMKGAAAVALGVAAPFVRSARAAGTVVVTDGGGTWGAAQKAAYFDPFEKETGIKVTLVPYALPGKIRSSVTAGVPVADAVDLSGSQLPSFVRDGLLEPIDTKYFAPDDLASLSPVKADPHAIPSLFGAIVLAYGKDAFKQRQPAHWPDLWDFHAFPGPRSLADGGAVPDANTFEIALLADGVPPEKLYPLDWDRALKSLDRLRPKIAKFWTGFAEPVQLLVDQSAVIASAYNGRVTSAQADGAPVEFSWNQGILGWDHWVVPKGAPNADNAFKFIAFATRADRQAAFAKLIDYGPTNSRAYSMLNAERSKRLPTAPGVRDLLVIKNYDWWAQEASTGVSNELHATQIWEKWLKSD